MYSFYEMVGALMVRPLLLTAMNVENLNDLNRCWIG